MNTDREFISNQDLIKLVAQATGDKVKHVEKIKNGVMTHKYELTCFNEKELIIRFYPESIRYALDYEPDIIRKGYTLGAAVPHLLYDSRGSKAAFDFIIYHKVIGQTLSDYQKESGPHTSYLTNEIFHNVSIMRKIKLNGFGPLINGTNGMHDKWEDFINESIHDGLQHINNLGLSSNIIKKVKAYLSESKNNFIKRHLSPNFIWSDMSTDNIIINNSRLSGLIDFDGAMSGDIAMEAGYLYARDPSSRFSNSISNHYYATNEVTFESVKFFSLIRLLRICKFLNSPLPNGNTRSKPDLIFPGSFETIHTL